MAKRLTVPTLIGERVRLELLRPHHAGPLLVAATEDRSTYDFTNVPGRPDDMDRYVSDLLAQHQEGVTIPFVQVERLTKRVVGITRFLTIRIADGAELPYAVEIGGTWLAASAQRTGINREAKVLLLGFAFETWHVVRVDLKTDARNERSREAIAGLGATFEGVLRSWQPSQADNEAGRFRDSAMFSILADEWPAIHTTLGHRLR